MSFATDKQTLEDLNIFGKRGRQSVFSLFSRTASRGGAAVLEQMFRFPLDDEEEIGRRSRIIRFFLDGPRFPFKGELFDIAEQYLSDTDQRSRMVNDGKNLERKFRTIIGSDTEHRLLQKGVAAVHEILHLADAFTKEIAPAAGDSAYEAEWKIMTGIVRSEELAPALAKKTPARLSFQEASAFDRIFRFLHREKILKLLSYIYNLDVYTAVAAVAVQRRFVFPEPLPKEEDLAEFTDVFHPLLDGAVPNTLHISPDNNIVFLTGANMAGKSTFMKSVGIALYLAHMGFPVAAAKLRFSVRDGILTTINLADDLNMGYSHFYAEVLRVKKMAEQVGAGKRLFFIVDELFRGTNVKDAYEATIAITGAFARKSNCMFVVSTHIIEAGDVLKAAYANINFVFLPTLMENNTPVYTYRLETGITSDRHGMVIIQNEGILDILKNGKKITEDGIYN